MVDSLFCWMDAMTHTIPIRLRPKARPRRGKGGHYYTPDTGEDDLRVLLVKAVREGKLRRWEPGDQVHYVFGFRGTCRGDGDNYEKLCNDAGNGVLWEDDRMVKRCSWEVREGEGRDYLTVRIEGGK